MTTSLNLELDLVAAVDGFQSATLRRSGSALATVVPHALRRPLRRVEAEASRGRYVQSDAAWHLPAAELPQEPRVGDVLVDAAGQLWTLLEVARETLGVRWRCVARNLAMAHGLDDLIRLLRATWRRGYSGATLPEWREVAAGVAARVQPVAAHERVSLDRAAMPATHQVFAAEPLAVQAEDLIVDAAGRAYRVTGVERAERIDQLQVIQAIDCTGIVLIE